MTFAPIRWTRGSGTSGRTKYMTTRPASSLRPPTPSRHWSLVNSRTEVASRPGAGLPLVDAQRVGELVQSTDGAPQQCPRGHRLGAWPGARRSPGLLLQRAHNLDVL